MKYKYMGHDLEIFSSLCGYICYMDFDLEPQTISESEYLDIVMNGEFISFT